VKPILAALLTLALSASFLKAGEETYKETAAAPVCPAWYADREWNVSVWGTYTFTANDYPTLQNADRGFLATGNVSAGHHDRYLEADHAWGGGVDGKFFFARYFGIGVQGYALDVRQSFPDVNSTLVNIPGRNFARTDHDQRAIGAVLGTLTFRYPISCSRFAPYVFAGGGEIFGGGQQSTILQGIDTVITVRSGSRSEAVGQFGGGLEVRLTPHIGLVNDFTWNVVDGRDNNFGMARTGVNFAF
jgi:hypothetical protein